MRSTLTLLVFAAALFVAVPARAQLRANVPSGSAPVAVYGQPQSGFSLGQFFNAKNFRVGHSYEMSYTSFGGEGLGLGVYTTSLRWQPTDRLAARVDVGVAHTPFGSEGLQQRLGFSQDAPAQVFLRNAELAYRPSENAVIHLQVRQSPFGGYASPYGHGYGPGFGSAFRAGGEPLFWRTPAP